MRAGKVDPDEVPKLYAAAAQLRGRGPNQRAGDDAGALYWHAR